MTPISYTMSGQVAKFRYDTLELKAWISLGNAEGNVGMIVVSIDYAVGGFTTYKGYGTIENPRKNRVAMHMKHLDIFGKRATPDEILHPKTFEEMYPFAGFFIPDGKGGFQKFTTK